MTWIPEVPLLAAFVPVPVVIIGVAGYRAGKGEGRITSGAMAGVIAGTMGGCAGGLTYVAFGKPLLNVVLGVAAGVAILIQAMSMVRHAFYETFKVLHIALAIVFMAAGVQYES